MKIRWLLGLILIFFLAACGGSGEPERLPNNSASILIVSPASSSVHPEGREIEVVVAVDNFELGGGTNNHWHIYVDGENWGMIFGEETSHMLFGVPLGEHEVSVYLANNEHVEYEEGDSILINIEE
ncbi:MAG: hypothetical protein DWQ07_20785 [Chloroflexi bacterium]|nr:MAG: hypothetical protein DWQ07_20785 [Chloroflexota bacterium]MBL1194521.1 hypothetical protein [Chloroflexota bacterium]NOH11809.1 hypothetical protein [Chloroflexota bacterium]